MFVPGALIGAIVMTIVFGIWMGFIPLLLVAAVVGTYFVGWGIVIWYLMTHEREQWELNALGPEHHWIEPKADFLDAAFEGAFWPIFAGAGLVIIAGILIIESVYAVTEWWYSKTPAPEADK